MMNAIKPVSTSSSTPTRRRGVIRILENSSRIRSGEIFANCEAQLANAARVSGSISNPNTTANLTARSSLSASSVKRATGFRIARSTPARKSATPPTKSITSPLSGRSNKPLTVKSRRCASCSGVENVTASGRRPSL